MLFCLLRLIICVFCAYVVAFAFWWTIECFHFLFDAVMPKICNYSRCLPALRRWKSICPPLPPPPPISPSDTLNSPSLHTSLFLLHLVHLFLHLPFPPPLPLHPPLPILLSLLLLFFHLILLLSIPFPILYLLPISLPSYPLQISYSSPPPLPYLTNFPPTPALLALSSHFHSRSH